MSMPSRCSETDVTLSRAGNAWRFAVHGTGETGDAAELASLLSGRGSVVISAWEEFPDAERFAAELRRAGTELRAFFVPDPGAPPWARRDVGGAALPETPPQEGAPEFRFLPLDGSPENREKYGAFTAPPRWVTIHNTAEPFSAAAERDRVERRRDSPVSFHFATDEREAVQILPLDCHGWHAGDGEGDGNLRSVGVEICRSSFYGAGGWLYRRAEANAVLLAAALLKKLDLPVGALRMHREWSGKYCPHRILDAGSWEEFRARVEALIGRREASALAARLRTSRDSER